MSRRIDFYKLKRGDNLAAAKFWNVRLEDIDLRLANVELLSSAIDTGVDSLMSVLVQRMNDTFEPLIADAEYRLNTFGVAFSAVSNSTLTIGTGQQTLEITEETRAGYSPTDYVAIRSQANPDNAMVGQLVSFNRTNGQLVVNVTWISGSGSTNAWDLRLGVPPDLSHALETDNPHQTTAAQVGAYTTAQTDAAILAQAPAAVEDEVQAMVDAAMTELAGTLGSLAFKSSIGIGDLTALIATQAEAEAGTSDNKLSTPLKVQQKLNAMSFLALATVAELLTGNNSKAMSPAVALESQYFVPLTPGATINWSLNTGFNFKVTLNSNAVLQFPSAPHEGKSGFIDVTQPAGGNMTFGFASGFTFDGGVAPVIDAVAARTTSLFWFCRSATEVRIGLAFKGVRATV